MKNSERIPKKVKKYKKNESLLKKKKKKFFLLDLKSQPVRRLDHQSHSPNLTPTPLILSWHITDDCI